MKLYLDLVVLLNFAVDYLLLLGTNRLSGFPTEGKRLAMASALGGLYSGACLLGGFAFLGNLLWRLVSLGAMAGIAFGWDRSTLKRCGVFVLLSMALGGVALGLGRSNIPSLILSAGGMWLLCRVAFGEGIGQREYVAVELKYGDRQERLIALRDSGNSLRDPVTGEPVLVIAGDVAFRLTGLTEEEMRDPLGTLARHPLPGLRLVPYQAVGQAGGLLLAMRFENVKIGTRRQRATVAFAAEGLGSGQMYQALTGGV